MKLYIQILLVCGLMAVALGDDCTSKCLRFMFKCKRNGDDVSFCCADYKKCYHGCTGEEGSCLFGKRGSWNKRLDEYLNRARAPLMEDPYFL